jgi:hypothetical protein
MQKCWLKYGTSEDAIERAFNGMIAGFIQRGEDAQQRFYKDADKEGLFRTLWWGALDLMVRLKEAEYAQQLKKEYTPRTWTNDDGTPCNVGEELASIYDYYVTVLFSEMDTGGSVEHDLGRRAEMKARRNVLKRLLEIIEYGH